ncbi:uncharacterized protein RCC_03091 [Ramularia collo-cygni]|uniref:Zn(2)-C6 fungal-type domain-containing protein n=1 Tax=Ramularia collo-cygni TaxID=112498 RepID=A0A2D3URN7_9PEZI|nr:uncharacterized protein RCC_03091 [Ramularia collo-cygni]CZT17258.1 uncharacterized protein RCC_03091 [Ramularia collo-cygni]
MAITELPQSFDSSPIASRNDMSQPEMTDMCEPSDTTWDEIPVETDVCTQIDALPDDPMPTFDDEHIPEAYIEGGLHLTELPGYTDAVVEVEDSAMLPHVSIFGAPPGHVLEGRADLFLSSQGSILKDAGSVVEKVVDNSAPVELEINDTSYIQTQSGQAGCGLQFVADEQEKSVLQEAPSDGDGDTSMVLNEEDADDEDDPISEIDGGGDLVLKKWDLRLPTSDSRRGFTSTWRDQDESGDYDPNESLPRKRTKRVRKISPSHQTCNVTGFDLSEGATIEGEGITGGITSDESSEPNAGLMVSLAFTTDKCKGAFKSMLARLSVQQSTRKRDRNLKRQRRTEGLESVDLRVDFKNKPIARCCWTCANIHGEDAAVVVDGKAECSLATDPTQWPCLACSEVGDPCALITEPVRKLACEDCKRRHVPCSFNSTRNHIGPCQQCKIAGHECIAGPVKEAIVPRLEYKLVLEGGFPVLNSDNQPTYTCDAIIKEGGHKKRRPISCVECSDVHAPCTYEGKWGACNECKRTGNACTIPHKNAPIKNTTTLFGFSEPSKSSPVAGGLSTDETPLCDSGAGHCNKERHIDGPRRTVRTITTSFSHPMSFNCDDETSSKPCHLCEQPALRFVGFGKVEASVIDYDDNSGFVEIDGGHRSTFVEPTALCTGCTTAGLSIIMCNMHQISPIPNINYTTQAEEKALSDVLEGNLKETDLGAFCSICPGLATLQCTADQEDGPTGCGLKLCGRCTATLVGRYDGSLGDMLAHETGVATEDDPLGFRADVELLKTDGVLMRYLMCLSKS